MKRIQFNRYGGPEEMSVASVDLGAPGAGDVLVRVSAAAINPVDWKVRQGVMKMMTGRKMPRAMGLDFAGTIEQVGTGVASFAIGDEVLGSMPLKTAGAFAELLIIKAKLIVRKPAALSFEQASVLPLIGDAAWRALMFAGHLKARQSVFINGAAGGVGQAAINIAKSVGASVAGRVGPGDMDEGKAQGLNPVVDYGSEIPASLNGRFDIVFDCNGSLTVKQGKALAKSDGIIIDINPSPAKFMLSVLSKQRKVVMAKPAPEIIEKIVALATAGKFPIVVSHRVTLDNAVALITELEKGIAKGKAVMLGYGSD